MKHKPNLTEAQDRFIQEALRTWRITRGPLSKSAILELKDAGKITDDEATQYLEKLN